MTAERPIRPGLISFISAALIAVAAILFCFAMLRTMNHQMNESATASLLSTTRVIQDTLEVYFEKDFSSLGAAGELYHEGILPSEEQLVIFREAFGFDWIGVADADGNGKGSEGKTFQIRDLPSAKEWIPEQTGFSDAYMGRAGRMQITLWTPFYQDGAFRGTVFGETTLSKYYTSNIFTFYDGDGRTYLFDSGDGSWILKSLGTTGTQRWGDDIYSMLRSSGNSEETVQTFRSAIEAGKTGTVRLNFNGENSYVCFLPLGLSDDWYIATVIARDALLREAMQIWKIVWIILVVACVSLGLFAYSSAGMRVDRAKESEREYRERIFSNIFSKVDSAFLIYEKGMRRTTYVSNNVGRLFGLEREWLEADPIRLFEWSGISGDDPDRAAFLEGTLKEVAVREVCVSEAAEAVPRCIKMELIPADLGQEIIVLSDITSEKQIQDSLRDAMIRAEEANRAKSVFLSAMSHDIRTPMNGITGMTAIAAAHLDEPERVRSCLGKIQEASEHLLNLINEVLDVSKIESGKMVFADAPFNVAEPLQKAFAISLPAARQKHQEFRVYVYPMEHEDVISDPLRLQQIAGNLISNAVKYTPEGGEIVSILQELPSLLAGYGHYELTVKDSGIGMTPEFQKRLFQPFEREEDVRISKIAGTGLGMSIVKDLVTLMMGEIHVESEKNQGSTFRLDVHLKLPEVTEKQDPLLSGLSVLVADPDPVTCDTAIGMLQDIGMQAEWVASGREALSRVLQRHQAGTGYFAVLLEYNQQQAANRLDLVRQIREQTGAEPFLVLMSHDWSDIEKKALQAGVNALLTKPLYKSKLQQKLHTLASGEHDPLQAGMAAPLVRLFPGNRVLLVEDNELNMEIANEILSMMDIHTVFAENGAKAVERFQQSAPGYYDLILMDIQMPLMNGYEATKAIRKLPRADSKTIPIVAMTADAFTQDIQAALNVGMNEHIAKPISIEQLVQVLGRFLRTLEKTDGNPGGEEGEDR